MANIKEIIDNAKSNKDMKPRSFVIRQRYEGCVYRTIVAENLQDAIKKYEITNLELTLAEMLLCHWDKAEEVNDEPFPPVNNTA